MSENLLRKPHSMGSLLPPNYTSDEGMFDLNMPRIRPAWLMNESIRSLDSKFPMVPAPTGSIIFYTTPLAEKLCQQSKNREFDLTDPLRPSLSYNCLHDEHLQVYFKSNDIRKRLLDDGFITNDGYVKCSLKEFNEYRQWIRKLKLDELHQARRQDEKQIEDAKKERLERIAMERDPELLEIMKRRREKRREQAKIHHQHIKKEQERVRKLEEIDRQRREKFLDMRMKNRDRIQIKRDLERERLRKTKSDNERQEHKIKLRIVRKMNKDNDERLKHLEERKNEAKQVKAQKLEEQWLRRKSWSVEHHEHQNQLRQFQNQEFQHNVEERNAKVAKQRRLSLVSYQEIAEANRRAFETQLENAEVFLAKLNHKKAEELKEWRKKFEAMQKLSMTTLGSGPNQSIIIKNIKKRARRQSAWDLESCLLKDLGIAEKEMSENAYSKIGVISRIDERNFAGDNKGALGSLIEDDDAEGQQHNKEFRFSIPTIVESLASIQEQSSDESDSDSDYCPFNNIPSVFRFKSHHDLQPISDSPELKPNSHIPEGEMRVLVKDYVQGVLQQSADVLGVDIKFQERLSREEIPRINDVKRIPELKTVELDTDGSNMRSKVKEYLSSILDKVEDKIQVTIKRPPEYEKIKQDREPSAKTPVETSVDDIIDSKLHYHNKRNVIRLYLCKILEDAAEQSQVNVTFPPQYQSFAKRLHRPRRKAPGDKGSSSDAASQMAGQHTVVLRAIACGTVVLESAERKASMTVCSPDLVQDIKRTASEIETMKNKYDKVRAKRLFHENLIMIATRTVVEALHHAVVTVRSQRRNSDFFMSDLPNLRLKDDPSPPSKEQTVLLKRQRSQHRRESIEANQIEAVPREIDFLSEVSAKKGGKNMSCQATTQTNKKSKKELSKFQEPNTHSANKKTGSEGKPIPKTGKQTGTKKADKKKDTQKTGDLSENSEETGKLQGKVEQQIGANNQKASSSDAIEVVVTETENSEARIQEIGHGSENAGDPKIIGDDLKGTMEHLSDENQTHNERILSNGGQLGDDGMEAPVSTLSMASPSLPNVTPEPSGFGPPPDEVRSGAVPPITEASNADRGPAGSPSSAIFRMISMRETRESCDLSPKSSYVILPTLTSSEGALINTRMAQLLSNDHSKTRGLETSSRGHLPALSPSPSNEDHFTDHTNEPVRLPSVPSVESCPSRSPTPVRSLSRSSQVELPHIDGSSTSLVGNVEQASVKTDEPSNSTGTKAPQNTAKPSKPIAATKVPGKPTPSSKTTPGSKLQPGKPPVRAKSEISRKQVAAPTFPPRKGGQVRSSVALVSAKQPATPTHQKKSGETTDPAKQKKQEKQGKPADTASPQDRPAKSKSMGEAMATARRNSQGGSHNKVRRPSDVAFHTSSIAELEKNFAKPANRKSSTTVKSHLQFGSTQEKSNAPTSNDAHGIAKPSGAKKSLQDVKAKPARDAHAKSTNAVHTKSAPDDNKAKGATPSNIDHTKPEKDDNNLSVVKGHAKSTQNARVKSTQDTHSKPTQDAHAKSTKMAKTEDRPDKTTENTESKHKKDAEGLKNFDKNATAKPNKDYQSKDSQKSNLTGLSMKELKEKSKTVSATVTTAKESQDTSKPSAHQEEAIVSAPESESDSASRPSTSPKPTQSPSPKPTQSPSPKPTQGPSPKPARASSSPTSQGSREEDPEKPQSMRGALIMSPDVEELLRNGSPGESQKSSSHTILENTESETEFFRKNQIKKWDDSVAEPLVDETAENNARKKSRPRGTKPNVTKPKPKKPLVKKAKQSEDEAKVSDSKEKVGDGATKVSDSKAKDYEIKQEFLILKEEIGWYSNRYR
ncbi:microtubule-associated protein futsch-like [Dendronephthya gigantea]|uniref:microtubule-associated protein futsch-like n=1 Tax=Dendronephthya gigantea TaxID=151771 RepID=UPI00106ADA80|nr:microtubule-associated protein futsch-like [Dendronephthya gigantea]